MNTPKIKFLGMISQDNSKEPFCQGCILSLCLLNLYAEYIIPNARLDEAQAEIKTAGKYIPITSDMHMTPPLW